jgi:hypothetical protein
MAMIEIHLRRKIQFRKRYLPFLVAGFSGFLELLIVTQFGSQSDWIENIILFIRFGLTTLLGMIHYPAFMLWGDAPIGSVALSILIGFFVGLVMLVFLRFGRWGKRLLIGLLFLNSASVVVWWVSFIIHMSSVD